MANAFVIGYKNHALRIINHLVDSAYFDKIIIYHPNKLKLLAFEKISESTVVSNDFKESLLCSCVFISSPAETNCDYIKKILALSKSIGNIPYIYCEKPVAVNEKELIWLKKNFKDCPTDCKLVSI